MILVDIMMQIYRAGWKLSDLTTSDGRPTGMEFGVIKSIEAMRRFFKDEVVLCWEGRNNFRYSIDPNYKSTRRTKKTRVYNNNFLTKDRIDNLKYFLSMFAENAEDDELEGDDIIASLTEKYSKTESVVIYSGDKDLLQMVKDNVVQVKRWEDRKRPWDVGRITTEYNLLTPKQLCTYFAFVGDKIDDIPGVPHIRKDYVAQAIREGYAPHKMSEYSLFSYGTIVKINKHISSGRFEKNLKLVTLKIKDVPVVQRKFNRDKMGGWLENLEIRTLKICRECGVEAPIDDNELF